MQFSYATGLWRLISFIVSFSWNSRWSRSATNATTIVPSSTVITHVNLTTYLLVFYFHKTADKITVNYGKHWWEKTYFCQIHCVVARNEMKLSHAKYIFYSLGCAMVNVYDLRDCCRTYWPYLMAYYII